MWEFAEQYLLAEALQKVHVLSQLVVATASAVQSVSREPAPTGLPLVCAPECTILSCMAVGSIAVHLIGLFTGLPLSSLVGLIRIAAGTFFCFVASLLIGVIP